MKMYLISDNADTVTGMRLAGVDGEILDDNLLVEAKIIELAADEEIAVIFITPKIAHKIQKFMKNFIRTHPKPILALIPDGHDRTEMI
ncbi:V-type ATP synthase subunit F [Eubacteriales bacterium OttesenSCG-928-G02]|nr:V-type ATP synthase subunit F [Eubacteriales bacterium OttesenSCG-928-G02]